MTAEQEAILEQIIEAFQNGKRLSDLPDVSGTNPFNLICEVLEDGESKKAALATLLPYMEEECSYGIEFDTAVSSPACTRIGNLSLHKSLPIHNRMKGCLLNDDGEVVEHTVGRVPIDHVVDTTGCGDSFAAGMGFGYLLDGDILTACRYGNAMGAQRAAATALDGYLSYEETTRQLEAAYGSARGEA